MAITVTEKSRRNRGRSYDARTIQTCAWIVRNGKKRIHVPTLRRQLHSMSNHRGDQLGPQWKYWSGRSITKLEAKDMLRSDGSDYIQMTPKAMKIISATTAKHDLCPNDPRLFEDDNDAVWQAVARNASKDGSSPRKRNRLEDVDAETLANKSLSKMTKVELLSTAQSLLEKVEELQAWNDDYADTSLDYLDNLADYRHELDERKAEVERLKNELDDAGTREVEQSPVAQEPIFLRPTTPPIAARPSARALTRLASGSFINSISGQPTPESSEVDPSSPRHHELDDFEVHMDDIEQRQHQSFGHFNYDGGEESDGDDYPEVASSSTLSRDHVTLAKAGRLEGQQQVPTPTSTPPRRGSQDEEYQVDGVGGVAMAARVTELEDMLRNERDTNERLQKERNTNFTVLQSELASINSTLRTLQETHAQVIVDLADSVSHANELSEENVKEQNRSIALAIALNASTSELHRTKNALALTRSLATGWERKAQSLLDRVERNRETANRRVALLAKDAKTKAGERDTARKELGVLSTKLAHKDVALQLAIHERDTASSTVKTLSFELEAARKARDAAVEDAGAKASVFAMKLFDSQQAEDRLTSQVSSLQTSLSERDQTILRISQECDTATSRAKALLSELDAIKLEKVGLKSEVQKVEGMLEESAERVKALFQELATTNEGKIKLERELTGVMQDLSTKAMQVDGLNTLLGTTQASERSLHETLKKQKAEFDRTNVHRARMLSNLRQDNASLRQELNTKSIDLTTANSELQTKTEQIQKATQVIAALQTTCATWEAELVGVKRQLNDANERADVLDEEAEALRVAAAEDEKVINKMKAIYRKVRERQEEEMREADQTIALLNVSPLPARKRRRTDGDCNDGARTIVRDSGVGL